MIRVMKRYFYLAGTVLFVSVLAFFLSGCPNNEDLFPEYRGLNLIQDIPLSVWEPDQSSVYMNYEQVSGSGYEPPTGHDGADVYRLEINNLIPNGDFEASIVGAAPAGWTAVNGGGAVDTLEVIDQGNLGSGVASGIIDNNTMHFSLDNALDRIDFDLRDAVNGAVDGLVADASYLVRFNYRTGGQLYTELYDSSGSVYNSTFFGGENGGTTNISLTNLLEYPPSELKGPFPDITIGSSSSYYYSFGYKYTTGSGPQEGYIDNFRLIRTDIAYRLRLTLSFASDTPYPLLSGWYRFSIYVKRDPSAGTGNRFQSDRVSVGISGGGVASNGETFDESSFTNHQQYYDGVDGQDWSGWSQLKVDLFLQIPISSDDTKVMQLYVSPTDDSIGSLKKDIGSILISSPSLEMYPDGIPSE